MESRSTVHEPSRLAGLTELLSRNETWLMERVLAYALAQGYAAYTSTLVEPWRVSIAGLTGALLSALAAHDGRPHEYPAALPDAAGDPIAAFAILEAKRHRHRGVTLAMFWGLLKYYRRAYLDLLVERIAPGPEREAALDFVCECFDRIEFAFVLAWTASPVRETREALEHENRVLANEKNKYLAVVESIPHAFFILDDQNRVENCNSAALALIGHADLPGKRSSGSGEDGQGQNRREACGCALSELLPWLAGPLAEAEAGDSGTGRISVESVSGSGEETRFYNTVVERIRFVTGMHFGKVVLVRDVTERRRAESALAQSEERYRTLVDLMHQGLVMLSPDGHIDFANDTLGEMLGRPVSAVIGLPASEFIRREDRERFAKALAERRQGLTDPYEIALRRVDGRLVHVMSSPSPIIGPDGDYQGSLEVMTDVTHLRQLENQLAAAKRLEAIGQLAGGVAHEINTPLQYLTGNLDFAITNLSRVVELMGKYEEALDRVGDERKLAAARQDIARFRQANDMEMVLAELPLALSESLHGAERVASFVRSIKRFAQSESGGRRVIDINEAILATVEVAQSAQETRVPIELHLANGLPPLSCVPGDFNQLLLCLLLNAADAVRRVNAPDGHIRVSSQQEGQDVALIVSDDGPGIPLEIQDKIFNPFFSTKDVGKGGGQGLSIALSIVEKHHGTIRFVSEPGHGTTFHVTFPLGE